MAIESLGRLVDVVPIAAGAGLSMKGAAGVLFVCTGADTFTLTTAPSFAGSYITPGNIVVRTYKCTATNGTAAWTKVNQTASNAVVSASGTVAFWVDGASLPDTYTYVKVSVGASGLVTAIYSDLFVQRTPQNLAIKGA